MVGSTAQVDDLAVSSLEEGFTLVEMLVTLCLTALLSTLMLGAIVQLRPMLLAYEKNNAEIELDALGNYLQDVISSARLLALMSDDPSQKIMFEGSETGFRFVSVVKVGSDRSALRDVLIEVRGSGRNVELVQQNRLRRLDLANRDQQFVVATKLKRVKFQYLTQAVGNQPMHWLDVWSASQKKMPVAIKIEIAMGELEIQIVGKTGIADE